MYTHLKINEKSYSMTYISFLGHDKFYVSVVRYFDNDKTNQLMRQEVCSTVEEALLCADRISPKGSEKMVRESEVQTFILNAFLWDMYLFLKERGYRAYLDLDIKSLPYSF